MTVEYLPRCTASQARKVERCIRTVKAAAGDANPWAVCQARVGCATPRPSKEAAVEADPVMAAEFVRYLNNA